MQAINLLRIISIIHPKCIKYYLRQRIFDFRNKSCYYVLYKQFYVIETACNLWSWILGWKFSDLELFPLITIYLFQFFLSIVCVWNLKYSNYTLFYHLTKSYSRSTEELQKSNHRNFKFEDKQYKLFHYSYYKCLN